MIEISVYYKNKETGSFKLFRETLNEDDINHIMEERTKDSLPMWMDEKWEFNSSSIDSVKL